MILNEGGSFCSALVIDPRTLITAGHCLAGGRDMRVYWPGEGGQPVMRGATSVAIHPNYVADAVQKRKRSIDLGLVRLAENLPSQFSGVSLAANGRIEPGDRVTALGFGPTSRKDPKSAGVMRRANFSAAAPYGPSEILLWTSSSSAGICPGDSGGAMLDASGRLAAIIAWGGTTGASGCRGPAQGVLVGPQRQWIDSTLSQWGAQAQWE